MYPTCHINQSPAPSGGGFTLFTAAAVCDALAVNASPGAILIHNGRIVDAGPASRIIPLAPRDARRLDRPRSLLIPSLANAHVHLDLTSVGPKPYPGDFLTWINLLTERWLPPPLRDGTPDFDFFVDSATHAAKLAFAAGTVLVGDIARSPIITHALRKTPLRGVSFIELFGIDHPFLAHSLNTIDHLASLPAAPLDSLRFGIQPHAPYSAGPPLYQAAARSSLPVATHLAETPEEAVFVSRVQGPFRSHLERLNKWRDPFADHYCEGLSPVQWLAPHLAAAPFLLAHCNYLSEADIRILADSRASVVYCPRASHYFGHLNHPYRRLLDAAVNVCLGTDSIICHSSLSILDEMHHLYHRDRTPADLLLKMATTNGATALQADPFDYITFHPEARAAVLELPYDRNLPDRHTHPLQPLLAQSQAPTVEPVIVPPVAEFA